MTPPSGKFRIRRRGALLLIIATVALAAPITGRHAMKAYASDDDGGSNSGSGGGGKDGRDNDSDRDNDNDGGDDGGDDGGGDDGGSDDNDSDGGGGRGSSGKSGSSSSGSSGKSSGSSSQSKDSALATRLKGRIAPIREIESLAGKAVPGEIIDVKLYRNKDRYIYKVKIIQRSGSIYDVRIDAVNRKLLSARER